MIDPELLKQLDKKQHLEQQSKFEKDCKNIHDMPYEFRKVVYSHLKKMPLENFSVDKSYKVEFESGIVCLFKPFTVYFICVRFPVYSIDKRKETDDTILMNFKLLHDEIDNLLAEIIDE